MLITFSVLVIIVGLAVRYKPQPTSDAEANITLTSHTAESDSDDDGVPDWLEDVTESDHLDATVFPYQRDIAEAKNITVDELLYGGPGEFTEEIVKRFLTNDTDEFTVTEEEREKFIDVSVNYYIDRIEKKGLPAVQLSVNDTVSRQKLRDGFNHAIERFSTIETPIERLTFEVFAKNNARLSEARKARLSCKYTLANIPKEVPKDIYDPYFIILERIAYLCESLDVALIENNPENYFYAIKLMTTGKMIEEILQNEENPANTGSPYTLSEYITTVTEYLNQQDTT